MRPLCAVIAGLLFPLFVSTARLFSAGASVDQRSTLVASDIDAAIHWGESGKASPYLLHNLLRGDTTSSAVVGVVYTPFVRVALAAQVAFDAGNRLTREDVPSNLLEPVVYIAFRCYCCDIDHGGSLDTWNPFTPFDYHIAVPRQPELRMWNVTTRPVWVRRDLSVLNALGSTPYPDVVLVAEYPLSAVSQPGDFIIYRPITEPNTGRPGTYYHVGHVSAADVRV